MPVYSAVYFCQECVILSHRPEKAEPQEALKSDHEDAWLGLLCRDPQQLRVQWMVAGVTGGGEGQAGKIHFLKSQGSLQGPTKAAHLGKAHLCHTDQKR